MLVDALTPPRLRAGGVASATARATTGQRCSDGSRHRASHVPALLAANAPLSRIRHLHDEQWRTMTSGISITALGTLRSSRSLSTSIVLNIAISRPPLSATHLSPPIHLMTKHLRAGFAAYILRCSNTRRACAFARCTTMWFGLPLAIEPTNNIRTRLRTTPVAATCHLVLTTCYADYHAFH